MSSEHDLVLKTHWDSKAQFHEHPNMWTRIHVHYSFLPELKLKPIQYEGLQYRHPNTALHFKGLAVHITVTESRSYLQCNYADFTLEIHNCGWFLPKNRPNELLQPKESAAWPIDSRIWNARTVLNRTKKVGISGFELV